MVRTNRRKNLGPITLNSEFQYLNEKEHKTCKRKTQNMVTLPRRETHGPSSLIKASDNVRNILASPQNKYCLHLKYLNSQEKDKKNTFILCVLG